MLARNNWLRIFVARGIGKKALLILVLSSLLLVGIALLVFTFFQNNKHIQKNDLTVYVSPTITKIPTLSPTIVPTATPSAIPTHVPLKMVFGIGSQAGPAMNFRIVKEAPVSMLSSWYNGTKDLEWMQVQKNDLIPRLYAHKYIVHLITWTDLPEESIQTSHGPACGRPYPVSTQVVDDMKVLAQTYAGNGPLYVTLFTEFQTYTCTDNNWIGNENYYNALKDNFRKIKEVFHTHAPQSKVAISWGGWQVRYDDVVNKGGRSFFPYFDDILRESDFTSFQIMESDTNIQEMKDMTRVLSAYGKPIMIAHYKPASGSSSVFEADMRSLFTDEVMQYLTTRGVFAFSFMDEEMLNKSETSYQLVKKGIQKYGR